MHTSNIERVISALRKDLQLYRHARREDPRVERKLVQSWARKLRHFLETRRGKLVMELLTAMAAGGKESHASARIFLCQDDEQMLWLCGEGLILSSGNLSEERVEVVSPEQAIGRMHYVGGDARCRPDLVVSHIKASAEDFVRRMLPYA